ncbi:MAG TPA: YitT family protein [Negativicutes bacterium]
MHNKLLQHIIVGLGGLICAISINLFLVPHHLLSGGISGIAMIIHFWYGFPIGLQIFLMNIPILYAAYRLIGKEYTISTLYGMAVFSGAVDATGFLANSNFIDDAMLASIYGGIMSGIGSGMIFRVSGSAGGLDVVAAIMKKYYALNMGFVGFVANCVIMLIAAALFGVKLAMFTLISMFISANITDKVIEGFNRKKTAIIISENAAAIAKSILKEIGRGVTFVEGEGAFTHQNKKIIFVVVTLTQIAKIKFLIEEIDPNAFMIVQDAAEVMGRGFTLPDSRVRKGKK